MSEEKPQPSALPKTYDASAYEPAIYKLWEDSGAFAPSKDGEPYSIVLPPPNATGQLHLGHVVMIALEDCLIRYQRMKGKSVLWVPGTDHAALPVNAIMEKQLETEGKTKHDIGREAFLKRTTEYVESSKQTIRSQVRAMGASLDWSRERYTMEPAMNRVVSEVFVGMFEAGLIYRGDRIVNWDPKLETTVSDDEVERSEATATFYTLKYGPFEIGTARPETKFGDKYVVMHPDDKRYAKYKHGETFEAEWINGKVKATVIKDEAVDPKFGTGVMTITPWHDQLDFEIAERHKLDKQQIIGLDGKLLPIAGEFAGQDIATARPKIVEKLQDKGLLVNEKADYQHNLAVNSRGGGVIEPQIMRQWFVDVNNKVVKWKGKKRSLKEVMREVVESGDIKILPERYQKVYFHWIDNLRDWCISRQIWWGHQIPAYYLKPETSNSKDQNSDKEPEVYVGVESPEGKGWVQDPDTLDTWFSSSMWTWSTLLDPKLAVDPKISFADLLKRSPDFNKYHPTSVLETGYDILFFWVARMILMTTFVTGDVPFHDVYLHGMVRTKDGKKMSKSTPETAIDPLEMTQKYGADALRLAMMVGQAPGHDIRLYEEKIAGQRNFCNKLWNVARYVLTQLPEGYKPRDPKPESLADKWIVGRLAETINKVNTDLDNYRFSDASQRVYHLLWDDFADWYIESSKLSTNVDLLVDSLETILKLAHPFAPFVTEAIWQSMPFHEGSLLMSQTWPVPVKDTDTDAKKTFNQLQLLIGEIRNLRAELSLTENWLYHKGSKFLNENAELITRLTGLNGVREVSDGHGLHLTELKDEAWLDVEEQISRNYLFKLVKRRDVTKKFADRLQAKLSSDGYKKSAPKELVEETKAMLDTGLETIGKLDKQIENLEHELELYG